MLGVSAQWIDSSVHPFRHLRLEIEQEGSEHFFFHRLHRGFANLHLKSLFFVTGRPRWCEANLSSQPVTRVLSRGNLEIAVHHAFHHVGPVNCGTSAIAQPRPVLSNLVWHSMRPSPCAICSQRPTDIRPSQPGMAVRRSTGSRGKVTCAACSRRAPRYTSSFPGSLPQAFIAVYVHCVAPGVEVYVFDKPSRHPRRRPPRYTTASPRSGSNDGASECPGRAASTSSGASRTSPKACRAMLVSSVLQICRFRDIPDLPVQSDSQASPSGRNSTRRRYSR